METTTPLLMTMTEIAALARVRRPVVSTWRARSAASNNPFPAPLWKRGSQLVFDGNDVSRWLSETGRGNNASADRDLAAHAAAPVAASFDAITALLALRVALGRSLTGLPDSELLDQAEAADPDDTNIFSEIEAIPNLALVARYVDDLVDASYGEAPAYERMLSAHRRDPSGETLAPVLSVDGIHLVARIARVLASATATDNGVAEVVDATGAATDVIVEISRDERLENLVATVGGTVELRALEFRRIRRRLAVHTITLSESNAPRRENRLHLVVLGAPAPTLAGDAIGLLADIKELAVQLDESQVALVVAPSAVLSDGDLDRGADELRSGMLRSGQVRAIIRLPAGLRAAMPRQSLSLWVMGPLRPEVQLAERWTMVADLSTIRRNPSFDSDLISDLLASLGPYPMVRAHAFRFAHLVPIRRLLTGRRPLMFPPVRSSAAGPLRSAVDDSIRVDTLMAELGLPYVSVSPTSVSSARKRATIGQRLDFRQLRYIAGNRLPVSLVESEPAGSGRVRVIGPEEVHGDNAVGSRSVDRLRFASEQPSGRFTEPGDVVFCTAPRPHAIVDGDGFSVVQFPARILRVRPDGEEELLPDVLAADINARSASDVSWRSWPSRSVDPRQRALLSDTLHSLRDERSATLLRLTQLDELESVLVEGVAHSRLDLSAAYAADSSAPSKGTP